jgi:hydroxylamine dehydrogenase
MFSSHSRLCRMTVKEISVKLFIGVIAFLVSFLLSSVRGSLASEETAHQALQSPQTQLCINCHIMYTPGIVHDWMTGRHSKTIPGEAMKKSSIEKRISAESLPQSLQGYTVGCYECHSLNPDTHKDNFRHMGYSINVIVTPNDCKTCHPIEATQFAGSKKSYAHRNLMGNPVYHALTSTITGMRRFGNNQLLAEKPSEATLHETCLGCHGTNVERRGTKNISTKLGNLEIPDLTNWPNQGVGRVNPDGSTGACTACHPRHGFSIEVARKPYTCSQCHLEPDVPAWNVYRESKHGNIYSSKYQEWQFDSVPWVIGKDFKAPSCATCHNSLIVSPGGDLIIERTHDFGSRLWVRLFGLIYSHPQPKSGDTTIINNRDGLPLPVTFAGDPASEYLIDKSEQERRLTAMSSICKNCHGSNWTSGHFAKLDSTIKETNAMTATATNVMVSAWDKGIEDKTNPFDESLEQMWASQWLFYGNSIRYASAMTGAPDYASFKNGWWYLNKNLQSMRNWMDFKKEVKEKD